MQSVSACTRTLRLPLNAARLPTIASAFSRTLSRRHRCRQVLRPTTSCQQLKIAAESFVRCVVAKFLVKRLACTCATGASAADHLMMMAAPTRKAPAGLSAVVDGGGDVVVVAIASASVLVFSSSLVRELNKRINILFHRARGRTRDWETMFLRHSSR